MAMTSAFCVPSRGLPAGAFLPLASLGLGAGFAPFAALGLPAFFGAAAGFGSWGGFASSTGFGAIALPSREL